MNSLFISGTDTDVGKTYIAAGIAAVLENMNIDVGVMKPFAAGTAQKKGIKSKDVKILMSAAKSNDPESLTNPQFFPIAASPYTACRMLGTRPKINTILASFAKLSKLHSVILVEGMGGIMTPILQDYFLIHLIKDMKIPTVLVTRNRIGSVNHTILSIQACKNFKIPIKGIIINDIDSDGYCSDELARDLKKLTSVPILGIIPFIKNLNNDSLNQIFKKNLDMKLLVSS